MPFGKGTGSGTRKWAGVLVLILVVTSTGLGTSQHLLGASKLPAGYQPGLKTEAEGAYDYSNQTYHLVNFDPLSSYVNAHEGFEYPTLTSDTSQPVGIYYVQNETDGKYPFVEQSLSTNTVTTIADIIPLYQKFAAYSAMLDNEFFLEYGFEVALFFGTTTDVGSCDAGDFSLELVNLSTGYLSMWNTTSGVSCHNQQAQYLGNGTVAVISNGGAIEGYNLSTRQQWNMYPSGTLPFFEANNLYWLPQTRQIINVEAEGSSGDQIEVLAEGTGVEPTFTLVQTFPWGTGVTVNGVDGIAFNASYSDGKPALLVVTQEGATDSHLNYNVLATYADPTLSPTNTIDSVNEETCDSGDSYIAMQRYVFTSNYLTCVTTTGSYDSELWDPWNGSVLTTNITPEYGSCYNACFEGMYAPSIDYLLNYNASSVLAGGPSDPTYNVVYDYHSPSNPYPNASIAPAGLAIDRVTNSTIALSWANPPGPPINDTVYEGPSCGDYSTNYSLGTDGTSYTATGLAPATTYCFAVSAWTSAGQSPLSAPAIGTTRPLNPTALAVSSFTDVSVALAWTNPSSGTLLNDTVLWASGSCGTYEHALSTGGAATSATVAGLLQGTLYCFTVEAWSAGGNSSYSNAVSQRLGQVPDAPTGLTVTSVTSGTLGLVWVNPAGSGLINDTIYVGTSCGVYSSSQSLGAAVTSYTETGLASATSFCFAVSSWNVSGESPLSSAVTAATLPTAPRNLAVSGFNSTSVSLVWLNPPGTLRNVTVFWSSTSCVDFSHAASLGGADSSYSVSGLMAGVAYCFTVAAWSAGGSSIPSLTVIQRTLGPYTTAPPRVLVWPPLFGWPNLNPFNWIGLVSMAAGVVVLIAYRRMIAGPALIGAGLMLVFLLAV